MTDAHTDFLREMGRRGGLADGERRRAKIQQQIAGLRPLKIYRRGYQAGYRAGRGGQEMETTDPREMCDGHANCSCLDCAYARTVERWADREEAEAIPDAVKTTKGGLEIEEGKK